MHIHSHSCWVNFDLKQTLNKITKQGGRGGVNSVGNEGTLTPLAMTGAKTVWKQWETTASAP